MAKKTPAQLADKWLRLDRQIAALRETMKDLEAEQRPIETAPVDNDTTIVTKGLKVGERVVVNGQYRLQAGTRVDSKTDQASRKTDEAL